MKKNRKKIIVISVLLLLLIVVFIDFTSSSMSGVRNVDMLKIFAAGLLTGVIISMFSEMYFDGNKPEKSSDF